MERQVFISYVRDDDDNDLAGISTFADHLRKELSLLSGDSWTVWIDQEYLKFGDDWNDRIREALLGTSFFMPIVTPAYFKSTACREEVLTFSREATRLGLEELIIPVYYVSVREIEERLFDDAIVALIAKFQRIDWRRLRTQGYRSSVVRGEVELVAQRLLDAEREANSKPVPSAAVFTPSTTEGDDQDREDGGGGTLDILAGGEMSMLEISPLLEKATLEMNTIREIFDGALHSIERSDALGRGASGRLVVAKELANKLEPPGRSLNQISHEFAASVSMVDPAQNHILDVLDVDEKQRSESTEYLDSLIVLAGQAKVGMLSMLEFADTTHEARNWSKDLRKPIDTIEAGVRRIADTQAYFVEWANRATRIKEGLLSDSVDT